MPDRLRTKALKVLVVTDDARGGTAIRKALRRGRSRTVKVIVARSFSKGLRHLMTTEVDLVLLDLGVHDCNGIQGLRSLRDIAPKIPIVAITDADREHLGILALQGDAQDYLLRHQLNPGTLTRAIRYALEPSRWQGQYRNLLSISPDGVLILDADDRVVFVNPTASDMLGQIPTQLEQLPAEMRIESDEPRDVTLPTGIVAEVRAVGTLWSGRSARLVTMRDITERRQATNRLGELALKLRRANDRLAKLADTDPLTQLYNRRGIEEVLGQEVSRTGRTGDQLIGILVDCDDFKSINDSFGHGVGDAALAALARSIERTLRAGDHVGRVGGDEFLVLLPATTMAEGLAVAQKIRGAIKATVLPLAAQGPVRLSASLGVAAVRRDVVSIEEVMSSLHEALQHSKRSGKDTVSNAAVAAAPSGQKRNRPPLLPGRIPLAVVVQPIRSLEEDRAVGLEALIRGPPGPLSMPDDLFRAAFEENVLTAIDLRALRASVDRSGVTERSGWYHVNLFPSTLLNTPTDRIVSVLERCDSRDRPCIELSEQQFLGDPTYLRPRTRELQEAGYRIAIDDVGFGRSSVEALILLDPDVVKVDGRCIQSIADSPGDRRQLERLLAMLRAVGATVIVEGVETGEQLEILRDLGVSYAQGFFWGEPEVALPPSPPLRTLPGRAGAERFGIR